MKISDLRFSHAALFGGAADAIIYDQLSAVHLIHHGTRRHAFSKVQLLFNPPSFEQGPWDMADALIRGNLCVPSPLSMRVPLSWHVNLLRSARIAKISAEFTAADRHLYRRIEVQKMEPFC
jgi:hypothetical protein